MPQGYMYFMWKYNVYNSYIVQYFIDTDVKPYILVCLHAYMYMYVHALQELTPQIAQGWNHNFAYIFGWLWSYRDINLFWTNWQQNNEVWYSRISSTRATQERQHHLQSRCVCSRWRNCFSCLEVNPRGDHQPLQIMYQVGVVRKMPESSHLSPGYQEIAKCLLKRKQSKQGH